MRLSLDKDEFGNLPSVDLVNSPGAKARYLIKKENSKVVAFIKIPAGKAPLTEDLGEEWSESSRLSLSDLTLEPSSKNPQ